MNIFYGFEESFIVLDGKTDQLLLLFVLFFYMLMGWVLVHLVTSIMIKVNTVEMVEHPRNDLDPSGTSTVVIPLLGYGP